jgi:hypothetical protein
MHGVQAVEHEFRGRTLALRNETAPPGTLRCARAADGFPQRSAPLRHGPQRRTLGAGVFRQPCRRQTCRACDGLAVALLDTSAGPNKRSTRRIRRILHRSGRSRRRAPHTAGLAAKWAQVSSDATSREGRLCGAGAHRIGPSTDPYGICRAWRGVATVRRANHIFDGQAAPSRMPPPQECQPVAKRSVRS